MFHKPTDDIKPCSVMRPLISAWIDDKLSFIARRFTEFHVAQCPRCGNAVHTLRAMTRRLGDLTETGPDGVTLNDNAWRSLQVSLSQIDQQRATAQIPGE